MHPAAAAEARGIGAAVAPGSAPHPCQCIPSPCLSAAGSLSETDLRMPKRVSTKKKMSAPPAPQEPPARIDLPEHQEEDQKAFIRDIQDIIQDIVQDGDAPGSDTALPPPAADSEEADEQGEQDEGEEDEQDEGSCYWDVATMAPLNAVSAVSTVLYSSLALQPSSCARRPPSPV